MVESLTLLDQVANARSVPADHGIYYAIRPDRARRPYPGWAAARPAAALAPRRVALELAAHTFLESSADLVLVSLPTRSFTLLVFQRGVLDDEHVLDLLAAKAVSGTSLQLRTLVDASTLPYLYIPLGLIPTPCGRDSILAAPWNSGA